jgi:YD repeat-containing protein
VISDKAVTNIADDAFGRTASVRTGFAGPAGIFGPYASYGLSYDERDRLSAVSATGPSLSSTQTFGYDLAGRLTSWTRDGAQTSYGFDLSGNLTSVNAGGTQTTLAYNVDDQLTSSTAGSLVTTFGNDVLGRRTSKRSAASTTTTTYGYDAMGHLTSFRSPDASATYSYGATGMREVKVVSRGSVTTTVSTLWSAGKPVVERDGDGTTLRYLYGPGGLPLSLQVTRAGATNTYHYLTDALGSVAALVSETGTVAASYAYDPWGRVTSVGGADAWLASRCVFRSKPDTNTVQAGQRNAASRTL